MPRIKLENIDTMIELKTLRIGDRLTMRYPNGILQEALLVDNEAGMLKFQFGAFVPQCVGPFVDIFLNGSAEWSVGSQ